MSDYRDSEENTDYVVFIVTVIFLL